MLYLETRLGQRLKISDASGATYGDAMDVSALDKGKGKGKHGKGKGGGKSGKGGKGKGKQNSKGKGKGSGQGQGQKETRTCNNCGKVGHLVRDCWKAGGGAANKGQTSKPGSSGNKDNKSKGGKKGVSNLEEAEPEAETAETGFLSIAGLEEADDDIRVEIKSEEDEFPEGSKNPEFEMVRTEESSCPEPCDSCFHLKCQKAPNERHRVHECNVCGSEKERLEGAAEVKSASKSSVRAALKMQRPESFHYVVDKTVCLLKGITREMFHGFSDQKKESLRSQQDPNRTSREANAETLKQVEAGREDLRLNYFEKMTEWMLTKGTSQTSGHGTVPGQAEPSRSSGSAEPLPARPVGTSSSSAMHRTLEMHEVSNLDAEKREKTAELEECEDEDEYKAIESRIAEIDARKAVLKEKIRGDDAVTKEHAKKGFKLTKDTLLDQSWHDARYHQAVKAGVSHSKASFEEKKRCKATLHRKEGTADRAKERLEMDARWHEEFDKAKVKDDEFHDETAGGIEIEAVVIEDDNRMRVLSGKAKVVRRGRLKAKDKKTYAKSERTCRKLNQEEISQFKVETKEDEKRVMMRQRVNIHKARKRIMTRDQKTQRSARVKAARLKKRKAESLGPGFYLQHPHGERMCFDFRRSFCRRGTKCNMHHSEVDRELRFIEERQTTVEKSLKRVTLVEKDEKEIKGEINSFENWGEQSQSGSWTKLTVNFDTGAAVTAVPRSLEESGFVKGDAMKMSRTYKTASGELLEDEGGVTVRGYDAAGRGRCVDGRLINVHRVLASGSAVAKKNLVMLEGSKGAIIPKGGKIAAGLRASFARLLKEHPDEARSLTQLYEEKGIYVFDLWLQNGSESGDEKKTKPGDLPIGAVGEDESGGFPRQAVP